MKALALLFTQRLQNEFTLVADSAASVAFCTMPENFWSDRFWERELAISTPAEREQFEASDLQAEREAAELQARRRFDDWLLLAYGYKPWKRPDRRNRPLRTKRGWVSFRARVREIEILAMKCAEGLTFREIGERLGISHVAAWKRFECALENIRLEREYRAKCLREIRWKQKQAELILPHLMHFSAGERRKEMLAMGLIPKRPWKRRSDD